MIEKENTRVSLLYTVKLESGEIVKGDPETGLAHMDFVTGYRQALPGLEDRLIGRQEGESLTLAIPPEEAFGLYDPSMVEEKSFEELPEAEDFVPGKWGIARNAEHRIAMGYFVKEKKEKSVVLDYNHPLAGKTLIYSLKITEARPASQEELEVLRPCQFDEDQAGQQ